MQQKVESNGQFPRVPSVVPFPVPAWPSSPSQLRQSPNTLLQTGVVLAALIPVMHVSFKDPLSNTSLWH